MKTLLPRILCVSGFILLFASFFNARAAGTNPPPRLTIELRDGSRVIGDSVEKYFKFHSALLGDFKLDLKDIRSVECVSSNAAKLSTANGDSLTVSFVDSEFAVKTSFGKVALAVDSVRKFSVSVVGTGAHPPGLVAFWSGDGDGNDSVGGNNATFKDISFAEGKVGQAFSFNGTSSSIKIPASPALDVGAGGGFTIMAWIKPANQNFQEICEWNLNDGVPSGAIQIGTHLEINEHAGDGSLVGGVVDATGIAHNLFSAAGIITPNSFQHIAMTYDKASGVAVLYRNGVILATTNLGVFTPQTSFDFFLGDRPSGFFTGSYFQGEMGEIGIYNRALSVSEIQAVCTEQNNGEQLPPPTSAPGINGIYRNGFNE